MNGKVAKLESKFFSDSVDGWVEVVNQNNGNHASTVINQVSIYGGGCGGGSGGGNCGGGDLWPENLACEGKA